MLRPFIPTPTALLFPLSCRPLSLSLNGSNFADEEKSSYLESINRVLEHSPAVDLAGDSTSATSPGYRCFLAGVAKVAGPEGKPAALRRGPLLFPAAVQAAFTKITTYVPVLATS